MRSAARGGVDVSLFALILHYPSTTPVPSFKRRGTIFIYVFLKIILSLFIIFYLQPLLLVPLFFFFRKKI